MTDGTPISGGPHHGRRQQEIIAIQGSTNGRFQADTTQPRRTPLDRVGRGNPVHRSPVMLRFGGRQRGVPGRPRCPPGPGIPPSPRRRLLREPAPHGRRPGRANPRRDREVARPLARWENDRGLEIFANLQVPIPAEHTMRRRSRLEPRRDGPPDPRDNPIRALDLRPSPGRAIRVPLKATGRRNIRVEPGSHRNWNGDRSTDPFLATVMSGTRNDELILAPVPPATAEIGGAPGLIS